MIPKHHRLLVMQQKFQTMLYKVSSKRKKRKESRVLTPQNRRKSKINTGKNNKMKQETSLGNDRCNQVQLHIIVFCYPMKIQTKPGFTETVNFEEGLKGGTMYILMKMFNAPEGPRE